MRATARDALPRQPCIVARTVHATMLSVAAKCELEYKQDIRFTELTQTLQAGVQTHNA
jgi:hypothetical protein